MIVVGTRGHGPVVGVVVGSVTQQLLNLAPCPVLAVPPATRWLESLDSDAGCRDGLRALDAAGAVCARGVDARPCALSVRR